jgi:sec-independent protein translocase protein TatA
MPDIGWPEVLIIVLVLVLLFGAKKLPELARGSGRALRIFKAETRGLMDDDDDDDEPRAAKPAPQQLTQDVAPPQPQTQPGQHATPSEPLPPTNRDG